MLKLINTDSYLKDDEPAVTILSFDSSEGIEKKAAHEEITAFTSTLKPKEGYTYLHINAMGAGEYYSSNRNADYFPEENLKKSYKTFETSPAYVYRSHINKDPARSYGKVIFSIYNDRMHRVELIAECPNDLVEDINSRIKAGDFPSTSMAAKIPSDTCSICGNVARTRQEYCSHLTTELNKLYPDGRKVMALNIEPLRFFDISIVVRPADITSSVLNKIANDVCISSAELAEIEGINESQFTTKKASFKKLSEIIKDIPGGIVVSSTAANEILSKTKDLPISLISSLHNFELDQVLTEMANMGISPSLSFLSELIARKHLGEGYEGIGALAENYISKISPDTIAPAISFEQPHGIDPLISYSLAPYIQQSSLLPSQIEKRASNVGYAGLGPNIEPTWEEEKSKLTFEHPQIEQKSLSNFNVSYGKLLLGLGASALLSKMFITSQIEKKFREVQALQHSQNGVKIILIKSASDFKIAAGLSNSSLNNSLNPDNEQGSNSELLLANKITGRVLKGTGSVIGGKLAGMLRMIGIGHKLNDNMKGNTNELK